MHRFRQDAVTLATMHVYKSFEGYRHCYIRLIPYYKKAPCPSMVSIENTPGQGGLTGQLMAATGWITR